MTSVVAQLERFGPERCEAMSSAAAREWCLALAHGHEENFSVLSALVPPGLRDDFAAVYSYCRCSDDLGDEVESPQRALELLAWWRQELAACFAQQPRHPVFVALASTVARHRLEIRPFADLISAFEQDQTKTRYATWDELTDYCTRSADPVGRIVLGLFGQATPELCALSDCTCTALQLTNHIQDVRRDLLERNRIYLPQEATAKIADFEQRLRITAQQGFACDHQFLEEYRAAVRPLVERVWVLFQRGDLLPGRLSPEARPVVELFGRGGQGTLQAIENWNFETCVHRPKLSKGAKLKLVLRAWVGAKLGGRR